MDVTNMTLDEVVDEMRELHASGGSREDFERMLELFITMDARLLRGEVPKTWQRSKIIPIARGEAVIFSDGMMINKVAYHEMLDALEFYACPSTYHAISFVSDPPCGEFMDDFDGDHESDFYTRWMPGKRAREALRRASCEEEK